jgi:hypothetical protein
MHCGRWSEALSWVERGIDYTREIGLEAWLNCLTGSRGVIELALGAGTRRQRLRRRSSRDRGTARPEIAKPLVLSQKTVDHHVSAILRKLGVSTRGQAGAAAGRLGLIPKTIGR